jgi:hypothetical protein
LEARTTQTNWVLHRGQRIDEMRIAVASVE